MTNRLSSEQWSKYWEKGRLTTFVGRFDNNYDGDVMAFWHLILRKFPTGSKIVDLAAGNGALAILAASYGSKNKKDFQITAIDYARVDPSRLNHKEIDSNILRQIDFKSNTRIESTGCESGFFDCAISQFGFEYGNCEESVTEVSRILKKEKATFCVMVHKQGSVVHKQSQEGLNHANACEQSKLHSTLRKMLIRIDNLKKKDKNPEKDKKAEELRDQTNQITESLHKIMANALDTDHLSWYLKNCMVLFSPQWRDRDLQDKLTSLSLISKENEAYKQRMSDIISAARSPSDIELIENLVAKEGFTVDKSEPFMLEGMDFAQVLIASR